VPERQPQPEGVILPISTGLQEEIGLPSVGRTVTVRVANYVTGTPDQERDVLGAFDGAHRNEDPGRVL
jgi:hypothetical protein